MNAVEKLIAAALFTAALMSNAQAGDFRAWLLADAPAWAQDARAAEPVQLDWSAEACLACHNGARGRHITVNSAESSMGYGEFGSMNHPIGMRYADYAMRDPGGYQPRGALGPEMWLVDGKVTCITCHRLNSDNSRSGFVKASWSGETESRHPVSRELTAGPRETDLCIACHIK